MIPERMDGRRERVATEVAPTRAQSRPEAAGGMLGFGLGIK